MSSPHRLILASAGTGKTWQLTARYLELLLAGAAPESILATTFTRKAAGEILDRVLKRLVALSEDEDERRFFEKELGRPIEAEELQALLANLTRRLHRFSVRTLDAFFVHLGKLFALDLGLPADWTIIEDAENEVLIRNAIGKALAKAKPEELLGILRGLQQADSSRSIEWVLQKKVDVARDAFLDSHAEAWNKVRAPKGLSDEELEAALRYIESYPTPRTKAGKPVVNWTNALEHMIESARARSWASFLEDNTLVEKALGGLDNYSRHPIPEELVAAISLLAKQAAHDLVERVVLENAATYDWLSRFEEAYDDEKSAERSYRFEDLPKALHPKDESRIADQDLVWYRLDGRIDHILLDEFQDTAPVQWRILENLASEVLADGTGERSFFCVGDVKQSIYGWREAEPRLLSGLPGHYPQLAQETLALNYRSAPVVLDTVNRVFAGVGASPAFKHDFETQAAEAFAAEYEEHSAHGADLPGAVWLVETSNTQDNHQDELDLLNLVGVRVEEILTDAPAATIGILLRRNNLAPRIIYELRDKRKIHASGEGGNPLTDSVAVQHLLSLLLVADHPGDTAAAFHVAHSPLGEAFGLRPDSWREERMRVAREVREALAHEGYGPFCGRFTGIVDASYGTWDRTRFGQLVDLAHAFEDRADLRPDLFVAHVRNTRVEDPSAAQVQVMTIHAAKGLEFDAVVLPELDLKLVRNPAMFLRRPEEAPGDLLETVTHGRSLRVCVHDPGPNGLQALHAEQSGRELRESLCLLYVAMTRARHRLDMVIPYHKNLPKSYSGVLHAALAPGRIADEHGVIWAHPDNAQPWYPERIASRPELTPTGAEGEQELRLAPPKGRMSSPHTASATEGGGKLHPRDLLRAPRAAARLRGTVLHRWYAEIEWIEDFSADEGELLRLARELGCDEELARSTFADFEKQLSQDVIARALSRPKEAIDVWREREFSVVLPGNEHWAGAFDRVVLLGTGSRPTAAELIDFKTDDVEPAEVEARAAYYRPQIESYRHVLAHMTGLDPSTIRTTLLFTVPGIASS